MTQQEQELPFGTEEEPFKDVQVPDEEEKVEDVKDDPGAPEPQIAREGDAELEVDGMGPQDGTAA
jgi:hypothetical protein